MVSRERFELHQALKLSFLSVAANLCLKYGKVRLRKSLPQLPEKYGFKVRSILTAINSGKSRQTSEVILNRITSEFNKDFTNFAPLKLNAVQLSLGYVIGSGNAEPENRCRQMPNPG